MSSQRDLGHRHLILRKDMIRRCIAASRAPVSISFRGTAQNTNNYMRLDDYGHHHPRDLSIPLISPPPSETAFPITSSLGRRRGVYIPVWVKFWLSFSAALGWGVFSYQLAQRWIADLSILIGPVGAHAAIFGIAILPGFMNAFMVSSLLLDRRPRLACADETELPPITILIAAYNEESSISDTLHSISMQQYPGPMRVVAINDGSTDRTAELLDQAAGDYPWLDVIHMPKNSGKSAALNTGFGTVTSDLVITIDGDSYLYRDALANLVRRMQEDPESTAAVAGAVLVRNSRKNLVTRVQEWDYFHGIAAVKRIQSLYQGTLVAQGAFSIYRAEALRQVGGWQDVVGEDIVLTWALLEAGYRVGYSENACLFTNAPETWRQFVRQRQRWSRGLIEAFKSHWRLLFKARFSTMFIWWNALFPYLDLVYSLVFVPGLILALFGYYYVAGPMTLIVLPLAMLVNFIMYQIQNGMFREQGLKVRRNIFGFTFYALLYSVILQPACVIGYLKEVILRTKNWGTK